jgi:hypothetical protein
MVGDVSARGRVQQERCVLGVRVVQMLCTVGSMSFPMLFSPGAEETNGRNRLGVIMAEKLTYNRTRWIWIFSGPC